ncbi:hypothetical protein PCL_05981 [Purpureocillium lilacinum]|uniref:Uncharacterized protein n=1 Tax=Purpureocillium lilacinum TaxID=33203 RepID=A0A2U3ELF5_PURLI|nr:hypothetical protein PCL_05981 [Purpureocillium lilacinum]
MGREPESDEAPVQRPKYPTAGWTSANLPEVAADSPAEPNRESSQQASNSVSSRWASPPGDNGHEPVTRTDEAGHRDTSWTRGKTTRQMLDSGSDRPRGWGYA